MKNCSDSAQKPAHDREDCKQNANTHDSDGWRNFCHADTWAQLMREPSVSPVPEDSESDWWAESNAEQLARHSSDVQKDQLMRETSASPVLEATKSDRWTDSSAQQPARHSSDAQSSMTALVTHNPASSSDQPAVLQSWYTEEEVDGILRCHDEAVTSDDEAPPQPAPPIGASLRQPSGEMPTEGRWKVHTMQPTASELQHTGMKVNIRSQVYSARKRSIHLVPEKTTDVCCPYGCALKITLRHDHSSFWIRTEVAKRTARTSPVDFSFVNGKADDFCPACTRHFQFELTETCADLKQNCKNKFACVAFLWTSGADNSDMKYVTDALVLGHLLQEHSSHKRVLIVEEEVLGVPGSNLLKSLWDVRIKKVVEADQNLLGGCHQRFKKTFAKLRAWELTEYEKVCILDLDLCIQKGVDQLFGLEAPAALYTGNDNNSAGEQRESAEYFNHHNDKLSKGINAGVMLIRPSISTFRALEALAQNRHHPYHKKRRNSSAPEQHLLSYYFKGEWKKLPLAYNFQLHQLCFTSAGSVCERNKQKYDDIHILHFSTDKKPRDYLFQENEYELVEFEEFVSEMVKRLRQKARAKGNMLEEQKVGIITRGANQWLQGWKNMFEWLIDYVVKQSPRQKSCPLCGNSNHRNVEHRFFCCSGVAQQRMRWHNALLTAADSPLEALLQPKNFRISLEFVSQVAEVVSQPTQTAGSFEGPMVPSSKASPIVPIVPKGPVVPFRKCAPGPIVPLTKATGFKSAAKWMAMKKKKNKPLGPKPKPKWMAMKTKKKTKAEKQVARSNDH